MEWVAIFLGVLIAVALYTQIVVKYNDHMDKMTRADVMTDKEEEEENGEQEESKPEKMKLRFCPLCKSELKKHESLYAEYHEGEPRPKVIIHGCRYCYIPSGIISRFNPRKLNKET